MNHTFKLARRMARNPAAVLAVFVGSVGACTPDNLDPSTETGSAVDAVPAEVAAAPLEEASLANAAVGRGTPFGFWRLEYSQLGSEWTSLHRGSSPNNIRRDLETARKKGARVFVQFAGRTKHYRNSNGTFSLEKFKALLSKYKGLNLDSYIADGTLAGHMMIDEPSDKSNWHGRPMSYADVEQAAKASKAIWPKLPTLVRTTPSWLKGARFRWVYLDGAWAQYSARKGDVNRYLDAESRAAKDQGLAMVWGLNVIDGGNGSSRRRGTSSGKYNMSAGELQKYGKTLLGASNTCGFLMWMYEKRYMSNSTVVGALKSLSNLAKSRPARSCGNGGKASSGSSSPSDNAGTPRPSSGSARPTALFGSSCGGRTCKFTDRSTLEKNITRRRWAFGDGSSSSARNPSHTYSRRGTYSVVLTVTARNGKTDNILHRVTAR